MLGPWKKIGPASEYLGVSERKLREWVASKRLKHHRTDGVLYFAVSDLDAFMLAGDQDTPAQERINKVVDDVVRDL